MASAAVSSEPGKSPSPFGNAKFLIAGGVIALAVAYLIIMGLQNTSEYFLSVSELQQRGATAQNQRIRVSGDLVPGSLAEDTSGVGMHFQIADPTSTPLVVEYHGGQVPDIMGDNIEIVAEGKLDGQGTFVASSVLAKCPSRLENAPPEEHSYGDSAQTGT
jgi:cytochrome c-type biogenesis protein CcmE